MSYHMRLLFARLKLINGSMGYDNIGGGGSKCRLEDAFVYPLNSVLSLDYQADIFNRVVVTCSIISHYD